MTTHSPADLLSLLAPPSCLIDWLESVFDQKRRQGQEVPAEFVEWLTTWQDIRTDAPCPIDAASPAQWAELSEGVGQRLPVQPALLDVPRKAEYA
jgi:hypothetical protein